MAIGHDVFGHLEYEGTLYISSDVERRDDDFVGFVFGYQNNRLVYQSIEVPLTDFLLSGSFTCVSGSVDTRSTLMPMNLDQQHSQAYS